ncbi:MAG: dihydrolipoyl dehydrogenase [Alphaproteobacteria bacterium]|jgi:dihydrolipoamide dehydrogenase|nr:dihydrolipoyl dehydrogenase [Alphaproteobacteria bacterium]MBT5728681.1 dihydrolipoyl dehydrogenase [Alphaproteobacteria bacterium]MBT7220655.1 dihydrolipoyl dehydrogenase [Alphaproteobacteria bacterium]MDG1029612.1 dihydrolipoyl dehydrogenase [Alphaproteobacteria bacterium]HAD73449.1 dihydrolipoyl dehydrogenase [Alphaproteobacteria bacterium]
MSEASFDLIVIGGGPAGYVAAIRASQLGMTVACIDKRDTLGGTCLNVGCIPSKALLNASEKFAEASSGALEGLGVKISSVKLDLDAMMESKDNIVSGLTSGIAHLFKKNKITRLTGSATITAPGTVELTDGPDKGVFSAERILIATGSVPTSLPGIEIDEKKIVSSTGALALEKLPKKLVVIGAGYIGLEMGTVWSRLGTEVEVVEYLPRILPGMDLEVANKFKAMLTKQGLKFHLGTAVKSAKSSRSGVTLTVADAKTGEEQDISCDIALVSVGRKPNTDNLGLEALGVEMTDRGQIAVDADFETNIEGIFAVGDVIPGPMLAHKAEEDAVAAVEIMAGQAGHVDYDLVPGIVYTAPEIATLGATEEMLKEAGTDYKKGVFPFLANSRAKATGHTEGFVKILADAKTDKVLGCHIIAHEAGTLIHEVATAMAFGASSEDIARTCHGHPTMNEAVKEAALAVDGRAIHI